MNADLVHNVFRVGDTKRNLELKFDEETLRERLTSVPISKRFGHEKYFKGDPIFELFFAGRRDDPKYCLGVVRWQQMPYFSFLDFRNLHDDKPFVRDDRKILNLLFTSTFDLMHSEGRFSFFYATRIRPFPVRRIRNSGEIAPIRGVPVFERYDFTIEAEVPIGSEPRYPYQQSLIRLTERSFDYWLKRGTLKLSYLAGYYPSLSR